MSGNGHAPDNTLGMPVEQAYLAGRVLVAEFESFAQTGGIHQHALGSFPATTVAWLLSSDGNVHGREVVQEWLRDIAADLAVIDGLHGDYRMNREQILASDVLPHVAGVLADRLGNLRLRLDSAAQQRGMPMSSTATAEVTAARASSSQVPAPSSAPAYEGSAAPRHPKALDPLRAVFGRRKGS